MPPAPPVEVVRRPREPERAAATALAAAARRGGHPALSEERWLELDRELRSPGAVPGFAALLVHAVRASSGDPGDQLLAYGQLRRGPATWDLEVATDTAAAARAGEPETGVREAVVRRALALVAEAGGGALQLFVPMAGADDDLLARDLGLDVGRELVQMRRRLPLEPALAALAGKVTVRGFRPGRDEAAWLAVNNAAFAAHPDQGAWDEAALAEHEALDWFEPGGLLMAEDAGRLVGFCWTKVAPEEPETGEIYVIGVAPDNQGGGLGAALLAAGCAHLARRGAAVVSLYVDADNEPALRLYRSAGFAVDHVDRVYTRRVDPADDGGAGGARGTESAGGAGSAGGAAP